MIKQLFKDLIQIVLIIIFCLVLVFLIQLFLAI